jgi:membrane protease subunit HflK
MKADYLSYRQATSRSLLGLGIQLVLALAMFFYGVYGRDHAAITASAFMLIGVLVWLTLAILFDQHRRERVEAMEAEAFAVSNAAASSVFEQGAQELRLAAKRLRFTARFLVPGAGLLVGVLMVVIGLGRFRAGYEALQPEDFAKLAWTPKSTLALSFGLPIAFVGFVFARYVAGMAKQKVWGNLRGGASVAVGSALFGLALAVGHFVKIAGPDTILRYLLVIFPGAMVVVGTEVILNFILELYRPRRPGEFPRPAFDSRLLGFVAAPDLVARSIGEALSYQFGHDVASTWFYRLLSRSVWKLVVLGVGVLWLMSSFVVIQPHQKALIMRFGRIVRVADPGLNFKLPWPIDRAEVPLHLHFDEKGKVSSAVRTVTGVHTLDIGTLPPKGDTPILWTGEHVLQETFFLVQPGAASGSATTATRSRDLAAVVIEAPLRYVVDDVEAFERLGAPEMRDRLLAAVAQREMMQYVSTLPISDLLSGGRPEIGAELRRRIERAFVRINPMGDGTPVVRVVFVGLEGVHPPTRDNGLVTRAFENVITAEQKYQAQVTDARARAIQTLTKAAGSVEVAQRIVVELDALEALQGAGAAEQQVAEQRVKVRDLIERAGGDAGAELLRAGAERWTRHMAERARLAAYLGQVESYTAAPAIYRASLYLDALREAMAGARVYIADPVPNTHIRVETQDRDTGVDVFGSNTKSEEQP